MATSKRPLRVPEDLAPDPGLTYDPLRSVLLGRSRVGTTLPTEPAIPAAAGTRLPAPPAAGPPAAPGEVFELRELLAQGGFGDVWNGVQGSLDRAVAVKRLRADRLKAASAEDRRLLREMFRQEALTTAKLEHPNIVPVYQLGGDSEGALLAMKLVRGRPWTELIQEDFDWPIDDFLSRHLPILIDVAQAVAYAHSRGILHRDLKPQQVMVGEFGEVLLMDWGLALPFAETGILVPPTGDRVEAGSSGSTTAQSAAPGLAGTPSFMAPEQTRGTPEEIGPWTDLYLLGGTLYYLLTGSPPHRAADSVAAFRRASSGEIEPPAERAPGRRIPVELRRLAVGVLAAEPSARHPPTVRELIAALQEYLSGASRKHRSRELIDEVRQRRRGETGYTELGTQLSRLQRAQALWPENPDVQGLRHAVLERYAEAALKKNDLELARLQAGQLAAGSERADLLARVDRALARRRAVARQRRLALVALGLLAAVLVVGAVLAARDQRRASERLAAERDAAQGARAEAAALMTFMLEDLWEGLARIERVDLLEPIARRADSYHSGLEPSSLTSAERVNRGGAFLTIGETLQYQGDVEGAIEAYGKAASVFRQLAAEVPARPDYAVRYLEVLNSLGQAQSDLGNKQGALATLAEQRRRSEAALRRWPEHRELEVALIGSIDTSGVVLYDLGELGQAGQAFADALALARQTSLRGEEISELIVDIELRLAVTQCESGEPRQALASIERSRTLAARLGNAGPAGSPSFAALSESIYAKILAALGRRREAVELLRAALPLARRHVDEDPTNIERLYAWASLGLELATIESDLGNAAAAEAVWEEVVDVVGPLHDSTDHGYLLDSLVRALLHLGRVEEARPVAGRLLARGWRHREFQELCSRHRLGTPAEVGRSPSSLAP